MSALQGYRTQQKSGQPQYQTLQQVGRAGGGSYASDTVQKVLFEASTADDAVEANSTKSVINATAHEALPGDMIRFDPTSANPSVEVGVISVTANTITLAGDLPASPVVGNLFKVMRWITPKADVNGSPIITSGPVAYKLNGTITEVSRDTVTPANSRSLPTNILDGSGQLVSPLTDTQLRATAVPVSGPLTDAQLRAAAVPVADSVLRATVGTDGTTAPASSLVIAGVTSGGVQQTIEVNASGHVNIADGGGSITVDAVSWPLPTGAATSANQTTEQGLIGALTETAPATDTASSGLNGRLQRVAQRLTSLIALLPASIGTKTAAGSLAVVLASDQTLPLPTGAATSANQTSELTLIGAVTETAPATDTASSGLNGRLQRIAQRLTSLIALLPASLGQKTSANSLAVVLPSDQTVGITPRVLSSTLGQLAVGGTLTAPANVKGYTIQNSTRAAGALRFREGSGASATVGFLLEPGQSTSYQDGAATLSIFDVDALGIDCTVLWYV